MSRLRRVHFRNIKGRRLDFMETFPDEGDMDMERSLATYREVGYRYMLMPEHVPRIAGRGPSGVAFAYCYGYIQGLIDALSAGRQPRRKRRSLKIRIGL
jgi:mannonate dehydratase